MNKPKYRYFRATLTGGLDLDFKVNNPITENYAIRDAWHYISKQYRTRITQKDVVTIKGIR